MNHSRRHILILCTLSLVTLSLLSCRPHGVLSSRKMRAVMVDLHKTDALLQVSGLQFGHNEAEDLYYTMVLEQHGITQAQFDSSLVWYTAHPQLFDKIYPKVLADLTKEREAFYAAHADSSVPAHSIDTPIPPALTEEQALSRMDSLIWTIRYGYPVRYWHEYPSVHDTENQLLP